MENLKCDVCGADGFETRRGLNIHYGKKHPDYEYKEKGTLKEKARKRMSETLSNMREKKDKYSERKKRITDGYECDLCDFVSETEKGLNIHKSKCHNEDKKGEFTCKVCGKEFESKISRNLHFSHVHKDSDFKICKEGNPRCGMMVKNLKKHLLEYHNLNIICNFCDKRFETKWGLWEHNKQAHLDKPNPPYPEEHKKMISKARGEYFRENPGIYDSDKNPAWTPKVGIICKECGEKFEVLPSNKDTAKYCSRECYLKGKSYFVRGLGHKVRSSWEEEIGLLLKKNNIEYRYEEKVFELEDTTYRPDFIVEPQIIVEPHAYFYGGRKENGRKEKYKEFNERYSEYFFIVIGAGDDSICDVHLEWDDRKNLIDILENLEK